MGACILAKCINENMHMLKKTYGCMFQNVQCAYVKMYMFICLDIYGCAYMYICVYVCMIACRQCAHLHVDWHVYVHVKVYKYMRMNMYVMPRKRQNPLQKKAPPRGSRNPA